MTCPAGVSPSREPTPAKSQRKSSRPKLTKAATIWFSVNAEARTADGQKQRTQQCETQIAGQDRDTNRNR